MKYYISTIFFMVSMALYAQQIKENTEKWISSRPDGHAPISVMGDHMHQKGGWMFSYRYMYMNMEDLKRGKDDEEFANVLMSNGGDYMVTPTSMPMNMHMLGAMYATSDKITLMAMVNYIRMEMDHLTGMGGTFTTESKGFGDTKVSMLYRFFNKNKQQMHGQIGVSIPTGTIENKDVTPASSGNDVILPYPMQIGSGTLDPEIALTYLYQCNNLSFGTQLKGLLRLGDNSNDYRLGNRYALNSWFAVKALTWLSFSARLEGLIVGDIEGVNSDLNPNMVITADTQNSGGTYLNSGLGFNLYAPNGALRDLRLGFEFATPILQDVNGVQLKTKETITVGLQYAF
ncbi:transporter [Winogradskyella echinorum]|uniref:Transporter n=1 Tax=Winogradskyella echinorum TaxID=538189 RepID=A0ABR6Y297_9FLAO|nr:transporter [Winogradskyella echinorum]MBC3846868.1 transporter [Winogradskyella echinorum]MBC5751216.1 transporter [Winogradskyella echinorum]